MILLYKGGKGKGKTLTMVKDGYLYKKEGWVIYANFNVKYRDHYINDEELTAIDKHSLINNAVLLIDEIQIFFDSRRSMKKESLNFSNFIQQVRKRNLIILCTTQYSNTVDLRLRQHLDVIAYPTFFKDFGVCEVVYQDLTQIENDFMLNINPKTARVVYDAKPFFKMYDTTELIK